MKQCNKCKKWKPEKEFYKDKRVKDGLRARCKKCSWRMPIEKRREYVRLNKEKIDKQRQQYCKKNRKRISKLMRKFQRRNGSAWIPFLKSNPKCEICNKKLKYFAGDIRKSVHFDHKDNNAPIKGSPSHWLECHKVNPDRVAIWNSCNFGILCNKCNGHFPTKNRIQWLKNIANYIKKN